MEAGEVSARVTEAVDPGGEGGLHFATDLTRPLPPGRLSLCLAGNAV